MGNRVTCDLTFGGRIPRAAIPEILEAVQLEGADLETIEAGEPIYLVFYDVNGGLIDDVLAVLRKHRIPYRHWFDGYTGEWGEGIEVYDGVDSVNLLANNNEPVISFDDLDRAESLQDFAEFEVPNVELVD